jgi:hypothetical protein
MEARADHKSDCRAGRCLQIHCLRKFQDRPYPVPVSPCSYNENIAYRKRRYTGTGTRLREWLTCKGATDMAKIQEALIFLATMPRRLAALISQGRGGFLNKSLKLHEIVKRQISGVGLGFSGGIGILWDTSHPATKNSQQNATSEFGAMQANNNSIEVPTRVALMAENERLRQEIQQLRHALDVRPLLASIDGDAFTCSSSGIPILLQVTPV